MMMRWVILSACTIALVSFTQADPPNNYFAPTIDKTGNELQSALHDIIDDHRVIKYSSSNPDTAGALAELDADPNKPNSVILIYNRRSEAISNFGTSSGWNREHLWCNSYGIDKRGPVYSDLHNSTTGRCQRELGTVEQDFRYQRHQVPEARPPGSQADKRRHRLVGTANQCARRDRPGSVLYGCPLLGRQSQ
jgi:endonuclease I